jgi:hypothetical protein
VATNDVGIIQTPDRGPIVVAAYLVESPAPVEAQEAVLTDVGRIVAEGLWRIGRHSLISRGHHRIFGVRISRR